MDPAEEKQHRAILQRVAHQAMLERGLHAAVGTPVPRKSSTTTTGN